MHLIDMAYNNPNRPEPHDVKRFLSLAIDQIPLAADEADWSERIQNCVDKWFVA
jgi:hypothetical protein